LKKVNVVKSTEVTVKPFSLAYFTQDKERPASIKKVTKKELKVLADSLGLVYSDTEITLSKKLLNAYLAKR